MKELKVMLENILIDDASVIIIIHCNIPNLTLRITDSRQMIMYGIGSEKQQGFTVSIGIDRNSNNGKKLRETLSKSNLLTGFKTFETKKSMIYVKDFSREIGLLEKTIHDILDKFDVGESYQLTVNHTDGNHTMK